MAATFQEFVTQERERLAKAREDALAKRAEADKELEGIDAELRGIAAYEAAKAGKPLTTDTPKRRRGPAPGTRRGNGGGKRAEVLDLIKLHPEGLTAGQISETLHATDKSGKQAVANALSALKGDGLITQAQKRGPYTTAPAAE